MDRLTRTDLEEHMRGNSVSIAIGGTVLLAGAAAIAATVVEKSNFKGKFAFTVCSTSEQISCGDGTTAELNTDIFLDGQEFSSKSRVEPDVKAQNNLSVTFRQFDGCVGEFTAAFGTVEGGFSARALQSAEFDGHILLRSFDDDSPAGTLDVAVTLEGFGATQTDRDRFKFDFEDNGDLVVISGRFSGTSRSATAAGTIAFNGDPISCVLAEGTLTATKSGFRQIVH
jgi:hypothetical protein